MKDSELIQKVHSGNKEAVGIITVSYTHLKVTTTIETYCHQSRDAQEKIADRLGKVDRCV